ncbi:MAG: hypothetical protein JSV44_06585 [Candidatus Zixiibacteriota bacterium]|nr:MAG: hypothetical protein JSV44_06585 [candidate division Zixibacteria bacterium]
MNGGLIDTRPTDFGNRRGYTERLICLSLFAIAMAYVEAAVVVYLRELYYPNGFSLQMFGIPANIIAIELFREAATIIMLLTVALTVSRAAWERFGSFIFLMGLWDIFYYVWLKATIDWPSSLFEWDVLFLLPVPWLSPVIAPALVALLMIVFGILIISIYAKGYRFKATGITWLLAIIATGLILYTFIRDSGTLYMQSPPGDFQYLLFGAGLVLYIAAFMLSYLKCRRVYER